ncbi:NADPH-dependent F420 reductase [Candidatus Amarolinea dominans]|uniref:NADPH-dependent F420 reductase n=1 Tax=Candidatus Amarolinea dominans TaxID=3140696 RepID=UPI001DC1D3EE|nr:NADPH-dependent F420 reductase [Anaerolineae bacterium]
MSELHNQTIAILGGTGAEGAGLAMRWARAGLRVIVGSRLADKGAAAAAAYNERIGAVAHPLVGTDNLSAAQAADIAVLTVPYAAHLATLGGLKDALQGKILLDVTVPLVPPRVSVVQLPAAGSACLEAQNFLGEGVQVVAAFQDISAEHLGDPDHDLDCDVLVAGNSREAKQVAIELAHLAGLDAFDAGPLANAGVIEGMAAVLIGISIRHKIKGAGIRLTGVPRG